MKNNNLQKKKKGSILIEFAFAIPILSSVLFFMTDAPKYYYLRTKMNNSTYFAVNLIQNVTQQSRVPKISSKELINIISAAVMNQFNARVGNGKYDVSAYLYYIECKDDRASIDSLENNTAEVIWCWHTDSLEVANGNRYTCYSKQGLKGTIPFSQNVFNNSIINYSGNTASKIMSGFKIAKGDGKIILELGLVPKSSVKPKKAFGFLMMPVIPTCGKSYFNKAIGFTPKPFLFDETPPTIDVVETVSEGTQTDE